ncbi:MAG: RNA-binding S4 domain-containing protein [Acidimicrobiales bacterium]|nr:RNA-binding S4 domain-containing protein [Hyphomonadaceae bacterium]RZV44464.1 MAG: RNA-binding S4 domain-containing protein [Acidimicrobiales bacterium]
MTDSPDELRLDVWLWRARFYKSRALSTRTVKNGKIRLERNGQTLRAFKPNTKLRPGDRLTFMRANHLFHIEVLSMGMRRGPANEAQAMYAIVDTATKIQLTA